MVKSAEDKNAPTTKRHFDGARRLCLINKLDLLPRNGFSALSQVQLIAKKPRRDVQVAPGEDAAQKSRREDAPIALQRATPRLKHGLRYWDMEAKRRSGVVLSVRSPLVGGAERLRFE
eukprot:838655-Prymnesium_polylepis.1